MSFELPSLPYANDALAPYMSLICRLRHLIFIMASIIKLM